MKPLNPFVRAFFASRLPTQCNPADSHILLVPTTEFLLSYKDGESQSKYRDLVVSEDFLASHILRLQDGFAPGPNGQAGYTSKDAKAKARQYATVNGKSVIIKDTTLYANKGFRALVQSQLLQDEIFTTVGTEISQWLVYYISRPLLGIPEPLDPHEVTAGKAGLGPAATGRNDPAAQSNSSSSGNVKSFGELLNHFPLIARQIQPGLDRSFRQFEQDADESAPPDDSKVSARSGSDTSISSLSRKSILNSASPLPVEASKLRRSLETLVVSSIELFQKLDNQQLSLIGSVTRLSGQAVDNMIERFVTEHVHDRILFPRICATTASQDDALQKSIKQMADIDVSQVGISFDEDQESKKAVLERLARGADSFKKMGLARSPQEMLDILLETERCLTAASTASEAQDAEKNALAASNADTLVSLFLIVVIRSAVQQLQARLLYMRDFILLTEVESGETGYALSTFEAVLSYLTHNSANLCKISRANKTLWQAVKKGDSFAVKSIVEKDSEVLLDDMDQQSTSESVPSGGVSVPSLAELEQTRILLMPNGIEQDLQQSSQAPPPVPSPEAGNLSHIFPFQDNSPTSPKASQQKFKKRVSMDTRSMSSSSARSFSSMASTTGSSWGIVSGEISVEQLCRTQDSAGNSLPMMAIENSQAEMLTYLLSLNHLFNIDRLLQDANFQGTTLLNAAFQAGHRRTVDVLLDHILHNIKSDDRIREYFKVQDSNGRSAAHYLFNVSHLIDRLAQVVPWHMKDNNGQTPLFALCRSYDHENYREMVGKGLRAASGTLKPLNLDDLADGKRNTLLHIVTDAEVVRSMLLHCESDPNAANDKGFTPLMVASKFARLDTVRVLFSDARTDLQTRDHRGLTAVEVAKDDEVRNRIDDLVLLASTPGADGRKTTITRSILVDDWIVRMAIKSGAPTSSSTMTVTTCRRSTIEFKLLAGWLALEHPASWIPAIIHRSPFQIPTKPSRQLSRDIQLQHDGFLKTLLTHPTFSTHEMVWEFFLVPDIDIIMLDERANRKAQARAERVIEEYEPLYDSSEVETFVDFARGQVTVVEKACKALLRRVDDSRLVYSDLAEARRLSSKSASDLAFLPEAHQTGIARHARAVSPPASSPLLQLHYTLLTSITNTAALRKALKRPGSLIGQINATREELQKHQAAATRTQRWGSALGLFDDTRARAQQESREKAEVARRELHRLGCELRYTQQTVASELAGWQESHAKWLGDGLRTFAKRTLVVEKSRLQGLRAALRVVQRAKDDMAAEP